MAVTDEPDPFAKVRETIVEDTEAAEPDFEVGDAILNIIAATADVDAPELLATIGVLLGATMITMEESRRSTPEQREALLGAVLTHALAHIMAATEPPPRRLS